MNLKIDKCDSKWLINITQKNETNFVVYPRLLIVDENIAKLKWLQSSQSIILQ